MHRIRRFRPSNWALVALALAVLASAGSAGAARLITSSQIANGTIRTQDLNRSVRGKLSDWFAKVDANGQLVAGRHVTSVTHPGPGEFRVVFNRSVEKCAAVASVRGTSDVQFYGFVTTYTPGGKTVRVVVRNASGALADGAGFNLVTTC